MLVVALFVFFVVVCFFFGGLENKAQSQSALHGHILYSFTRQHPQHADESMCSQVVLQLFVLLFSAWPRLAIAVHVSAALTLLET